MAETCIFFALDEDTLTSQGLKEPSVSNINKNMLRYMYVQQKNRMDSKIIIGVNYVKLIDFLFPGLCDRSRGGAHGLVAGRASHGVDHHLGAR